MKVIGVRFREVGKIYYYDPDNMNITTEDSVIVETERGIEFGKVILGSRELSEEYSNPLKKILRKADGVDIDRFESNMQKEVDAFKICKQKIIDLGLPMKLIAAEYTFDNAKVLFYFTAECRVDFRELVKILAAIFKVRIELRQVGVRDETKMVGGIGSCGRPLCCHSYLSDFVPVSIKMAKEQNLSLNPAKISGVCGRLMCCLKNESDTYEYLNKNMPKDGETVITPNGEKGVVVSGSVIRQTVKVLVTKSGDAKDIEEYSLTELKKKQRWTKQ